MYSLLKYIPKNHLSFIVGKIASIPIPFFLRPFAFKTFASLTGVDLDEVEDPLTEYSSVSSFFVRNLKEGVRPIEGELVSPVDGVLRGGQKINSNSCEQVKGKYYSLSDIIGDAEGSELELHRFMDGTLMTIYLSPRHYHHVHSPCSAKIRRCDYIPGKLWPVNDWSINSINSLFSINERLNIYLSTAWGEILLVMVGATNVGKMSVSFDDITTNQAFFSPSKKSSTTYGIEVAAGERLGTFHLGSTVLLIFEPNFKFATSLRMDSREVKYGQSMI